MKICPRCEIEFETSLSVCPLCNHSEFDTEENNVTGNRVHGPGDKTLYGYKNLSSTQRRKLFWEVTLIILLSVILVTLVIDVLFNNQLTWSKYTITICLVLFANSTLLTFLRNRLLVLLTGSFLSTSLLLILLDVYNNKMGWATQLGIPILFSLFTLVYFYSLLYRSSRQHGFNMLGSLFLFAGIMALCTEGIINYYLFQVLFFKWSPIVLVCLIPLASVLFFIHYRLKKGTELNRFFHI